jgi:hypothetical protein
MPVQVRIESGDVASVPSDLLLLKYAQCFYGADEAIAVRLTQARACVESELTPAINEFRQVATEGIIAPRRVMFLGVPPLRGFLYREIRQFARRAIEIIAKEKLPVNTLTCTVHGAGYGLDIEESLHAMVVGFQQGVATNRIEKLKEIVIVERNMRRFELLRSALQDTELVNPVESPPVISEGTRTPAPVVEPATKKSVFVAMPFQEEFQDVYQFGIYNAVRRCGYVCEKVDETVFAGSIIDRIMDGIKQADFVIADLTMERPNVYLEVGYAWGMQRPVILVARDGQRLHFDLSHHKCIFYRTIGKLAESLEATILDLFGRGTVAH